MKTATVFFALGNASRNMREDMPITFTTHGGIRETTPRDYYKPKREIEPCSHCEHQLKPLTDAPCNECIYNPDRGKHDV